MKKIKYLLLLLLIVQSVYCETNTTKSIDLFKDKIVDSTYSLYVWKIIGYQYGGPFWEKGIKDTARIGQKRRIENNKENVRAVCLGEEKGYYVFLTLRSFLDPTYPNIFLQGIEKVPEFPVIRYGGLMLTAYEHQGGGVEKVENKVKCITHSVTGNPTYSGIKETINLFIKKEKIKGATYEVPHEKITAKKHFNLQKEENVEIEYSKKHDIALIYIPKKMFSQPVKTLGIKNPTLSYQIILEKNVELLGFNFVLIGKETMELITNYRPVADEKYHGINKLINVAGLVLGSETLYMLKMVDETLDKSIPEKLGKVNTRMQATGVLSKHGSKLATELVTEIINDKKLKDKIIEKVTHLIN